MMKKRGILYNNRDTSVISMRERSSYEIKDRGDKERYMIVNNTNQIILNFYHHV